MNTSQKVIFKFDENIDYLKNSFDFEMNSIDILHCNQSHKKKKYELLHIGSEVVLSLQNFKLS